MALTKKEDTESRCPYCAGLIGIYYINGGLQQYCNQCSRPGEVLKKLDNEHFKMPFGRHQGVAITKLPDDYLLWGETNLKKSMRQRFRDEIQRRRNIHH